MTDTTSAAVMSPATPLSRLHGVAAELGITVRDMPADLAECLDDDTAAIVAYGEHIALSTGLDSDELRADVLAMAMTVAACMVRTEAHAAEADIVAPNGFVIVTRERTDDPDEPVGSIATMVALKCGRDTPSAAFAYYVPVFGVGRI